MAAHKADTLPAITTHCTATAARTGQPCRNHPQHETDRCHHHPHPLATRHRGNLSAASTRMTITGVGWKEWRFGDDAWQTEVWRLYDIIGQLRKFADGIGSSVSRCRLYVAEVDDSGEPGPEATDPDIAALAFGPLGKGPAKDENLRLLGLLLALVGEAYIVGESAETGNEDDRWYVISGSQIRSTGNRLHIRRPAILGADATEFEFQEGHDLLIRCWTPHGRDTMWATSSVRSAIPVLREIEAIMKRSFAELDSRLTGAGLLLLPENVQFPRGDDESEGVDGLAQRLMQVASISIEDRSSSEAMVPLLATVPPDAVDKIKLLTFWSELSEKLHEKMDAAIRQLASMLDIPPEVLTGVGDANHWTGWLIESTTITQFIEPILARIAEALDNGYLKAALERMGRNPDRYTYAFDTAPLSARPNKSSDALAYVNADLISGDAARQAGNYTSEDAPTPIETLQRKLIQAIPGNPDLLTNPAVLRLLGITDTALQDITVSADSTAPQIEGAPEPTADDRRAPPDTMPSSAQDVVPDDITPPGFSAAAALHDSLLPMCNYAAVHALGLAGSRLVSHRERDNYPGTPKHGLHVQYGPITTERAETVLRGAWDVLRATAQPLGVDVDALEQVMQVFCTDLLTHGHGYEHSRLADVLAIKLPRLQLRGVRP